MPVTRHFTWKDGNGNWNDAADWQPSGVPGAYDIAAIGNGHNSPIVTVPNATTPLPSPTHPDGVAVGALNILAGATLAIAQGTNVGASFYNLPSGYAPSTNTFTVEGVAPSSNAGTIQLGQGASLRLTGQIDNSGTVSLNAPATVTTGDISNLVIVGQSSDGVGGGVTLTGHGTILMSDSADNEINGTVLQPLAQDVLVSDNTIKGAGLISHLTFINKGTVDAIYANNFLVLSGDTITNRGLLESTATSGDNGLFLEGGTTIDNDGPGQIKASPGTQVWLAGATIEGGTLGGQFYVILGSNTIEGDGFDPVTIASGGNVGVFGAPGGVTLTLSGPITNQGTISLNSTSGSSGGPATLAFAGITTLAGHGNVTLSDTPANTVTDNGSWALLLNVDNTIAGAGAIGTGDKKLTLVNLAGGTIDANGTHALTIDTGNPVVNFGTIEATSSGGLVVDDPVLNFGDSLKAAGGNVKIAGTVTGGVADISNATFELDSKVFGTNVDFTGSGGTLKLTDAPDFAGTVAGLAGGANNAIDLADLPYLPGVTKLTFTENRAGTAGVLTVSDHAAGGATVSLTLLGHYIAADFVLGPDGSGSGVHAAAVVGSGSGSGTPGTLVTYSTGIAAASAALPGHH